MDNATIIQQIDLKEHLPDVSRDIVEMKAITDAETPTIQALWQACGDIFNDEFISTATEYGISRREKTLGIMPYATDTLEDRRFRLLTRYNENIPYTRRSLENLLASLCGEECYALTFITEKFTVRVKVALTAKKQVDTVEELLERILPYNMVFTVELLYNTWEKVQPYTWSAFSDTTWQEMKEEVLS